MKKMNSNRGVSLIVLVITIIILIILAGATISIFTQGDDVINSSLTAKEKSKIFEEKRFVLQSANYAMGANIYGIVEKEQLEKELKQLVGENKTKVTTIGKNFSVEFTDSKRTYVIDEDGKIVDNNDTIVEVPSDIIMGAEDIVIENKDIQYSGLFEVDENGAIQGFGCNYYDYNLDSTKKQQMENIIIGENVGAKSIGENAFRALDFIKTLYVSNSDLIIDISAFDSSSITSVIIEANRVESKSFHNLHKLEELTLKVNSIGDSAFENGKGKILKVRANIIGNRAFCNNSGLEQVDLKANEIGDELFLNCGNLKTASIVAKNIGNKALYNCAVEEADITANTIGNELFYNSGNLKSISIVTDYLGNNVLYGNSMLQTASITIKNDKLKKDSIINCGVKTITLDVKGFESGAFNNCYNLSNIIINSTLKKEDVATDFINNPPYGFKITYNGNQYSYSDFLNVLQ